MPADRRGFHTISASIHWLTILASLVSLGSSWFIQRLQLEEPDLNFWFSIHIYLGLCIGFLILLLAILWIVCGPLHDADGIPPWRRRTASTVIGLLYLSLVVAIVTGYLESVLGGRSISLWGNLVPQWGAADASIATRFRELHSIAAFLACGLIVLHVAISISNGLARRKCENAEPPLPPPEDESTASDAQQLAAKEKQDVVTSKVAKNLAKNLRYFGWIEFWVQFVIGLIVALLLLFASSGVAFSPSRAGFGNSIYWGFTGFLLLCPAVFLALYYTITGRKVMSSPINYLHHERRIAFWYIWTGLAIGQSGVVVSFVGVAMSISLLIVKTISQPPGIAITDPNNIIRALDVFVLIVNFMLLIAHFVGVVTALWLSFCASKARVSYISVQGQST